MALDESLEWSSIEALHAAVPCRIISNVVVLFISQHLDYKMDIHTQSSYVDILQYSYPLVSPKNPDSLPGGNKISNTMTLSNRCTGFFD
jgi:hypothetical protein